MSAHVSLLGKKIEHSALRSAQASLDTSVLECMRSALKKTFLEQLGLEVDVRVSQSLVLGTDAAVKRMESALFGYLDLPEGKALAGFSGRLLDTLATAYTSAVPTGNPPANRARTRTDAALAALFVETFLSESFTANYRETPPAEHRKMTGFGCEKAPLAYVVTERKYVYLALDVSSATLGSLGTLELALPRGCIASVTDAGTEERDVAEHWENAWRAIVETTTLCPEAVLDRVSLPISEILTFRKGKTLALHGATLGQIALETSVGQKKYLLSRGRLGSLKNFKAFKVDHLAAPKPERSRPMEGASVVDKP